MQLDTSNKEFQEALQLVQYTRQSVFLTGKAGTGKSTFLRYVCEHTRKKHIVLAPTGIAAINAGGSTLHSFFRLPFSPLLPDDPRFTLRDGKIHEFLKYTKAHRKLLYEVELIIIDEISMVRADIIDFIDRVLRIYSHNMRDPFGGKQMLMVGDVYQLEPVVKNDEREILNRFYPSPFFFNARVFQEMELVSICLDKVYRQSDPVFIDVLDHIRTNTAQPAHLQLLNTRVGAKMSQTENELAITLATRRDTVDYINQHRLAELPGDAATLKGRIQGDFPESSLPTQKELELKSGAQVIFVKNDQEHRWVNGTLGTISGMDENDTLYIVTEDGREVDVERATWHNIRYQYNETEHRIEEEELGTFTQFPIRLAWAITIHKSQGLTFSRVKIDLTGGAFTGGQTYVALSRCTSLEGITLEKAVTPGDVFVRPDIVHFAQRFNDHQAVERALKLAQADVQYAEAVHQFEEGDMEACLDAFFKAIHSRYDIEKPLPRRLLRRKLGIVNQLREENRALKERMRQQERNLRKYAEEYLQLGNMSVTQAKSPKAALANYDKALELCPTLVDAWVRKGVTLFNMEKHLEAERCLNEAVRLSPGHFKALLNRGKARLAMHKAEEALGDLDRATSLKPDNARAHELFGDALMQVGKADEAALHWALAEELRKREK
jgi:cytochrome c-type biogenesis protein CcmH/NrfG